MLEAQIPKDIRKYEAKLVGPFTTRQTICFIIACALAFFIFKVLNPILGSTATFYASMLLLSPVILIGWVKIQGIPFERFVQAAFISTVLSPKHRRYKIKNPYRMVVNEPKKLTGKAVKKKNKYNKKLAKKDSKYIAFK
jgi:hypothetical protein